MTNTNRVSFAFPEMKMKTHLKKPKCGALYQHHQTGVSTSQPELYPVKTNPLNPLHEGIRDRYPNEIGPSPITPESFTTDDAIKDTQVDTATDALVNKVDSDTDRTAADVKTASTKSTSADTSLTDSPTIEATATETTPSESTSFPLDSAKQTTVQVQSDIHVNAPTSQTTTAKRGSACFDLSVFDLDHLRPTASEIRTSPARTPPMPVLGCGIALLVILLAVGALVWFRVKK